MIIGVLDDNPALCRALEAMLALAGHHVFAYTDAPAFIVSLQRNNIYDVECIVVDLCPPAGEKGVEVISQVRRIHPHLPVVCISADPLSRVAMQDFPNMVFCETPFRFSTILAALDQAREQYMSLPLRESV